MRNRGLFFLTLFLLLTGQTPLNTVNGPVVAVNAGDSITIDIGKTLFKIRLAEVDSPDTKQPLYSQAMRFTRDLVLGKTVTVQYDTIDLAGQVIGYIVLPDGRLLNRELVRAGWAWYYPVKHPRNEELDQLQYEAWTGRLGLWVNPDAIPPWVLRREERIPDPPMRQTDVVYDDILSYGLMGDLKARTYTWPACNHYGNIPPGQRTVFSNLTDAGILGFTLSPNCQEALNRLRSAEGGSKPAIPETKPAAPQKKK